MQPWRFVTDENAQTPSGPRARVLVGLALTLSVLAGWTILSAYPGVQRGDGPQYHKML